MKLYNALTRQKEEFVPITPGEVKIYACGPTVYDLMHIGNACQICVFDTLRRYFEYRGFKVTYVQNFTDIDDKIITKAQNEGTDYQTISQRYIHEYFTDAHGLNVWDADIYPKATENIQGILEVITVLIEKGYAYAAENGDVYFSTAKDPHYGKLSHQPLEELKAGARITAGEEKREPVDFALWKSAKPGEPYWESPWGNGRPGWHIECSAMVRRYLGVTIDIHGGGQDLIFPHHENEIAQSECCNDAELAHYWVHNGMVTVDHKKMGKSLHNFFTVREVAERYGYEPIRFLVVSSQYRSPMNYSVESIEQAAASLERLYNCRDNLQFLLEKAESGRKEGEEAVLEKLASYRVQFIEAMEDDLNTADALSAVFELAREINSRLNLQTMPSKELCADALALFTELNDVLGLLPQKEKSELDAEIEALIERRNEARKKKDWATADAIRDELAARRIVLEDTPGGVKWSLQ